jgi:predicted dehydrogenase
MTSDPKHWCHKLLGGRFGENLPHPVYALQSILGDDLQVGEVFPSKRGKYPWMPHDEWFVTLQSDKTMGSIYESFNAARTAILIDVYGTKRILKIDLTNQTVIGLGRRSPEKRIQIGKDSLWLSYKIALSTMRNAFDFLLSERGEKGLRNLYTMFIDSIKKNDDPPVTSKMAYNTVRIVEEICQHL